MQQIANAGGINKWKGQIAFITEEDEMEYSVASIDPVKEDVQNDAEARYFRNRALTTNFMPAHMLVTDKPATTALERAFEESLKKFQGSRKALQLLWVKKIQQNQTFDLKKFDIQDVDKMFEVTNRTVKDSLIEVFGIPSAFLNVRVPGELGNDSKKLKDATDFYNGITNDDRVFIETIYRRIFGSTGINKSGDYSILPLTIPFTADNIPKEFLPDLSKNARLKLVEQPEEKELSADKPVLAVVLGVGATQAMMLMIVDPLLTPEQKRIALIEVFGVPQATAEKLIPIDANV